MANSIFPTKELIQTFNGQWWVFWGAWSYFARGFSRSTHQGGENNLPTVRIKETDDSEEEVARGRPRNVSVEEFSWSDDRNGYLKAKF